MLCKFTTAKKTIGEANKNPPKIPLLYVVFYLGVILPFTVQFLFSILNLLLGSPLLIKITHDFYLSHNKIYFIFLTPCQT
jgi:hypothetical protein